MMYDRSDRDHSGDGAAPHIMYASLLVLSEAALGTAETLVIHQIQTLIGACKHNANPAARTRFLALHRFRRVNPLYSARNRRDLDTASSRLGDKPTDYSVRMDRYWLGRFSVLGDERRLCTSGGLRH